MIRTALLFSLVICYAVGVAVVVYEFRELLSRLWRFIRGESRHCESRREYYQRLYKAIENMKPANRELLKVEIAVSLFIAVFLLIFTLTIHL